MKQLTFTALAFFAVSFSPPPVVNNEERMVEFLMEHLSIKYQKQKFDRFIYVAVKRQQLFFIAGNKVEKSYPVSTSRYGTGSQLNSEKTPLGLHKISHKTGEKTPLGGIIKGNSYTGEIAAIESQPFTTGKDEVTTRALRLEGIESGINKGGKQDSFNREIYIHGTPEEGLIGSPASHGCVRMKNLDVMDLFERVKEGTFVVILNN